MEIPEPLLPLWAMELLASGFLYAWLFCMGATVGSFLNVVVYRLPRGKNLAYPGSFCPRCGHPIRLSDNIPLLSWLALRGRCRDCGGKISARYFLVELTLAAAFLIVLVAEHFLPALSLGFAVRSPLLPHDGAPFWCRYAIHVVLVTTLIGATLLRADGFLVPARIFFPLLAIGLALPLIWPEIRSVPAFGNRQPSGWQVGLMDGLLGLSMGLATGALASAWARQRHWSVSAVIAMACSVGVVLGWQRTLLWFPAAFVACELAIFLVQRFATPGDLTEFENDVASAGSCNPSEANVRLEETASAPPPQSLDPP
jgi:leader peptidase (prepilin peptidase) / N-methyltransferase